MFANMTTPTCERSYVSIPCSLPTNIHSLQQHLKRCCPRGCSLAIQHHDLWPQGGEENAKKYPRANCCSKIRLHYLTISDLLCICYQYHLIYIYNYYIIYIYILYTVIYCWYLHHCALSPRPHSQQPSALRCWPHCQPSESPNAPPAAPRGGAPVQDNFEPVPGKNQQASRNGFQCLLRCF